MSQKSKNIYKRKDGRWEGRYIKARTPDGKAIYGSVYAHSYREVLQKQHAAAERMAEPTVPPQRGAQTDFCTLAEAWLADARPRIKKSSYMKYRNILRSYLLPAFRGVPLDGMIPQVIYQRCNRLLTAGGQHQGGLSPKTVVGLLSLIRSVFRYAEMQGLRPPCTGAEVTIRQTARKMDVLSRAEQEILTRRLCENPIEQNLGILLCLSTGLRIGELCALRWEDISLADRTLHVHQTMQRVQRESASGPRTEILITPPKSSCSERTIPLPEAMFRLLEAAPCKRGFFLTGHPTWYLEPRAMQYHFQRVQRECGLAPVNFHALRHTFATRCVESGFDVKTLSEILGHASVSITMNRYVHPSMELKRENMQRLSALFAVG